MSCIGRQPCTHNRGGSANGLPKIATAKLAWWKRWHLNLRVLRVLRASQRTLLKSEGGGITTETFGRAAGIMTRSRGLTGARVTGIMTRSRGLIVPVLIINRSLWNYLITRIFLPLVRSLHRPFCGQSATMKASGPGLTIRSHPYPRLGTGVRRLHPQRITYPRHTYPRMHRSLHRRQRDLHQQVPQLRDHVLDMLKYRRTFTP